MPRRYVSTVRRQRTLGTRSRVLRAASSLFLRPGYVGTTVDAVASRAGVSVQTVYNTVGGKAKLLKAVYDVTLAGDEDPIPISERPTLQALRSADDARTALALYARLGRELWERAGPLLSVILGQATAGDPALRAFISTIETERAHGSASVAAFIDERFGLRPGLSRQEAADILWTLTAPEIIARLVTARGWSLDATERWMGDAMADALLAPTT